MGNPERTTRGEGNKTALTSRSKDQRMIGANNGINYHRSNGKRRAPSEQLPSAKNKKKQKQNIIKFLGIS